MRFRTQNKQIVPVKVTKPRRLSLWLFAPVAFTLALTGIIHWRVELFDFSVGDLKQTLAEAGKLRDEGNSRGGARLVKKFLAKGEATLPLQLALAELSLDIGDYQTANAAIEKAASLKADPSDLSALKAHVLWFRGETDAARELLLAGPHSPGFKVYAARLMGKIQSSAGNYSAADAAFASALELDNNNSKTWSDISEHRLLVGNQKGAWQAAQKALAINTKNVRAIELLGRLARFDQGMAPALKWFERGLALSPDDIPLLEEQAATLGELGRASEMLAVVRKIVSLDRRNGQAYYMQAVIAARAGKYPLARRILLLAGAAINELPAAQMLLGISEYQSGNFNAAILSFQKLLERQPYNMRVRNMLARSMYRSGDALDSLEVIGRTAMRTDASKYSQNLAGRALEALDRRQEATKFLDIASQSTGGSGGILPEQLSNITTADEARRDPGDARRVIPQIRNLAASGQLAAAQSEADRLQRENPGIADAHILSGDVAMLRGQISTAILDYEAARKISFSEGAFLKLVDAYRNSKDERAARQVINAFLRANPANWQALRLHAYAMLDDGNWGAALPTLTVLQARIGYNEPVLMTNLARAYSGLDRHDEAVAIANTALKIAPANFMVNRYAGLIFAKSKKHPKASVELLEKALSYFPGNVDLQKALGVAKVEYAKMPKLKVKRQKAKSRAKQR